VRSIDADGRAVVPDDGERIADDTSSSAPAHARRIPQPRTIGRKAAVDWIRADATCERGARVVPVAGPDR